MVYNHTSPDSWLRNHHPEWFFHKADGSFGNQVADWGDIIDLDYIHNPDLWDYQIDTLKMWASIVDGFRCDVAPLVPVEFWERAREEVAQINPDCIWLADRWNRRLSKKTVTMGFTPPAIVKRTALSTWNTTMI